MREIKFRAFDTERKMYVPQGEIMFKDYGETYFEVYPNCQEYIHDKCHNGDPQYNRFIIEQYTDLKDKNGTDIYENDIIRILYTDWGSKPEDDPRTLEQYLTDISNIGEVVFNDNAWEVKIYSKKFDDYSYGSMNFGTHGRIEVIGNIHENNDLLTQHKN